MPLGTTARGFYSLHHRVDGYTREEEIAVLIVGKEVNEYMRSNKETCVNEDSVLSDTVLCFLVCLM